MQFVNVPNKQTFSPMPIVVCGAGKSVRVICLTKKIAGVETHWFGGHTIACCGTDNCLACQADHQAVWKGYFVGGDIATCNKGLIMVTDGAYESFESYEQHDDGFLGLRITISREGRRRNSPMRAAMFGRVDEPLEYPDHALFSMVTRIFAANAQKMPKLD